MLNKVHKESKYNDGQRDGSKQGKHAGGHAPSYELDNGYGYGGRIQNLRNTEFRRLGRTVYVDHAGATLYADSQLRAIYEELSQNVLRNPHTISEDEEGGADGGILERVRALTLSMFNASADKYDVIFTSGATGAAKLLADCLPWGPGDELAYTIDNHNSVLGLRPVALQAGASVVCVVPRHHPGGFQFEKQVLVGGEPVDDPPAQVANPQDSSSIPLRLFAFPAESNLTGVRYPLEMVSHVQRHGLKPAAAGGKRGDGGEWLVLVDAAKACACHPPDLSAFPADFVMLSYYKIFGYPTGVGALLVRKPNLTRFRKTYFGGGTVNVSMAVQDYIQRKEGVAGFEDGTPSFLSIRALVHGFKLLEDLGGWPAVDVHTAAITRYLSQSLAALRHRNGQPLVKLYGVHEMLWKEGTGMQPIWEGGYGQVPASPPELVSDSKTGSKSARKTSLKWAKKTWRMLMMKPIHSGTGTSNGGDMNTIAEDEPSTWRAPLPAPSTQLETAMTAGLQYTPSAAFPVGESQTVRWRPKDVTGVAAGQGAVVSFNVKRADGSYVGYSEVKRLAALKDIVLRTGCMCNPGACMASLGQSAEQLQHFMEEGHVCGDGNDVLDGMPLGMVRVSFGYMSTIGDANAVLDFVKECFLYNNP